MYMGDTVIITADDWYITTEVGIASQSALETDSWHCKWWSGKLVVLLSHMSRFLQQSLGAPDIPFSLLKCFGRK